MASQRTRDSLIRIKDWTNQKAPHLLPECRLDQSEKAEVFQIVGENGRKKRDGGEDGRDWESAATQAQGASFAGTMDGALWIFFLDLFFLRLPNNSFLFSFLFFSLYFLFRFAFFAGPNKIELQISIEK